MTKENSKEPEPLVSANKASQRPCEVRLDELRLLPERYCHRDSDELDPKTLELFFDSLILEGGVRVPVVFYTDSQGQKILISGHRRVIASRILAERNQPGFALDMLVKAIEVVDASPQDLLVESVSDNENRKALKADERLQVVKKLHDGGVEVKRAARALGVSDSTYARDLKVVKHGWLYQHVLDASVAATVAVKLVEAAEEHDRVQEFKDDLDEWVAARKKELKEKANLYKAEMGKDLRAADLQVRNLLKPHLVEHWLACVRDGRRFDDDAEWEYRATIDGDVLRIAGVTLNTSKASAEEVGKVYAGLSQILKRLGPIAQEKREIERNRQPSTEQPTLYDIEALRRLGLDDLADRLEEKLRKQLDVQDGEDDATNGSTEQRMEADLAGTVELPPPAASPPESAKPVKPPAGQPTDLPKPATPPAPPKRAKKDAPPAEPDAGDDAEEDRPPMRKV